MHYSLCFIFTAGFIGSICYDNLVLTKVFTELTESSSVAKK